MGTGAAHGLGTGRRQAWYGKWVGTIEMGAETLELPEGLLRGFYRNMGENKGLGHRPWAGTSGSDGMPFC